MLDEAEIVDEIAPEEPAAVDSKTKKSKINPDGLKPLPKVPGKPARGGGRSCAPKTLFEYWNALKYPDKDRVVCYVYRDHPKCDPTQTLSPEEIEQIRSKKKRGPATNIAKWLESPVSEPSDWKTEMLHQFGAGQYRLILNDTRANEASELRASGGRAIALAETGDIGDWETNPPVLNYEHVVRTVPSNESYVRWCKLKGIPLFGDPPTPFDNEETDDMANAEIIKQMGNTVDRLVDKVTEKNAAPPTPAAHDDSATVASRVADVMGNIAEKNFDMLARGLDRMSANKEKETDQFAVADRMIGMAERIAKTQTTSTPAAVANDPVVAALLEDRKAQREELSELRKIYTASLEARLVAAEARAAAPAVAATTAANPLDTFMAMLKAFSGAKELLADTMGLAGAEEEKPESKFMEAAKIFAPLIGTGLSNVASVVYNVTQMKAGGKPIPPTDGPPTMAANPALPGAAPQMNMFQFLEAITEDLKGAVLNKANGSEFAASLIMKHGPSAVQAYNEVGTWGDQILTRISMYPPLGSFYAEHPAEFEQFMGEFMDSQTVQGILQAGTQQQQAPRRVVRPKPDQRTQ